MLRNISSALDIIMSHITHFYHLAALDYLDVSAALYAGYSVAISPWAPQHLNTDSIGPTTGTGPVCDALVSHYVDALSIRRKAHIAAAEIDGKHPCQNAQVPGGMTTKPSTVNWPNVVSLVTEIRRFINQKYIPDVLAAALCFGSAYLLAPAAVAGTWPRPGVAQLAAASLKYNLWTQGYGCGNLLAYGCMPHPASNPTPGVFPYWNPVGALQLMRGGTVSIAAPLAGGITAGPAAVDEALITEDVTRGFYSSPNNLHPSVGQTAPDMTGAGPGGKYTWHKAPRYLKAGVPSPYEVGPLARMVINTALNHPIYVGDSDIAPIPGDTLSVIGGLGGPYILAFPSLPAYNVKMLVDTVLTAVQNRLVVLGAPAFTVTPDYSLLMSILGRHAARALECKFLADAVGGWATGPGGATGASGRSAGIPLINSVIEDPADESEVYNYQVMPKALKMGRGLTEAPRGALGHWITTEFRRIINYQAVVPSTWNACGRDGNATPLRGPIEESLTGLYTGYAGDGSTPDMMINRLLRAIHPFDICVACSVHMTDTKGNTITKFRMEPDGTITKEEVKEEAPVEA